MKTSESKRSNSCPKFFKDLKKDKGFYLKSKHPQPKDEPTKKFDKECDREFARIPRVRSAR